MAYRLSRVQKYIAFICLAAYPHLALAKAHASRINLTHAETAIARFYEADNDGVQDAYRTRSSVLGFKIGKVETCVASSGLPSVRPSVLANPPLTNSAIQQRVAIIRLLSSFINLTELTSYQEVPATEIAQFRYRVTLFSKVAHEHFNGDMFVSDESDELNRTLNQLANVENKKAVADVRQVDDILVSLLATLSEDFSRQASDSRSAIMLAIEVRQKRFELKNFHNHPPCSEPANFSTNSQLLLSRSQEKSEDSHQRALVKRMETLDPVFFRVFFKAAILALNAANERLENLYDQRRLREFHAATEALTSATAHLPY